MGKVMTMNKLYYGDNLEILRNKEYFPNEFVDLIYLDPPFKSNQDYNVLFNNQNGSKSKAQIKAFEDTWQWDQGAVEAYHNILEYGGKVAEVMRAFHDFLGSIDMMAYLSMMAPRLVELHRVLKNTGSIYLHCDPTASHYLKILMDAVFKGENFQNEIIWHYRRWTGEARRFQRMHDVLLFYAKNREEIKFNPLYTPYTEKSAKRKQHYHTRIKGDDVYVTSVDPRGVRENDVWDISVINPAAKERLGYPTQKPELLLERIIKASSSKGELILDPFCGCGTAIAVSHQLNRRWIGIDITHLAISLIKHRLSDSFGQNVENEYEVIGEPISLSGAKELAKQDRFQFQWWALGLVGARPVEQKKGADRGIDGRLYFQETQKEKTKQIIISVKSGSHVSVKDIRDLRGVIERENAEIGVLITLENPTKPMKIEATNADFYTHSMYKNKYSRIQILTIEEILDGKKIDSPRTENIMKVKTAQKKDKTKQANLSNSQEPYSN
jgi:site-specific DNA-methyltransferase (adenine-specific)